MTDVREALAKRLAENMNAHNASHAGHGDQKEHIQVLIEQIDPNPYQPRRHFDEIALNELAQSIAANGLASPIGVRKVGARYQIVHGERRWRAHKLLGKNSIEALLVNIDDKAMRSLALIENLQRDDLPDFDTALAIDAMKGDYGSVTEMANSLGIKREEVYRYLSFFDLPAAAIDFLHANHDLLGRAASYSISSLLKAASAVEGAEDIVLSALEKLKQGTLTQKAAISLIDSQLKAAAAGSNQQKPVAQKNDLTCGKKRLGTLERSNGNVVIKLKEASLNEDQKNRLEAFLAELVRE